MYLCPARLYCRFTKVKELVLWLMGERLDLGVAGQTQSHVVLYPVPGIDYSHLSRLDCNKLLQRVATTPELMGQLQDVKQQVEEYKEKVGPAGPTAVDIQQSDVTASVETAAVPAVAQDLPGLGISSAGTAFAAGRQATQVPGVHVSLTAEQLQEEQQQQGPKQQFVMYLKRRLLPVRVGARRAAVAEAWTEVYMRLDDPAKAIKVQGNQGQQLQQRDATGGEEPPAAAATSVSPAANRDGSAQAVNAAAGMKDEEDANLLQGLDEETAAHPLAAAAASRGDPATAAAGVSTENANATIISTGKDDDQLLLQGLQQEEPGSEAHTPVKAGHGVHEQSPPVAAGIATDTKLGHKQGSVSVVVAGDVKSQSNAACVLAEDILKQQPLLVRDLWQGFTVECPDAAQQLTQVIQQHVGS